MSQRHNHPFYDKEILRFSEQKKVEEILRKYKAEPVTEELKEKIWNELQQARTAGIISIPFKLAMRCDPYQKYPNVIEVILDTKL